MLHVAPPEKVSLTKHRLKAMGFLQWISKITLVLGLLDVCFPYCASLIMKKILWSIGHDKETLGVKNQDLFGYLSDFQMRSYAFL